MKNINWTDHFLNLVSVILGVSLAFYANNLAETKKENDEKNEILRSFLDDLSEDRETFLEYQIPANEEQSEVINKLLGMLVTGNIDTTELELSVSFQVNNYSPLTTTFNSSASTGKLSLIRDFELKKKISDYYEVLSAESILRGKAQVDYFMDHIVPWMTKKTRLLDLNIEDIQDDNEFINHMAIYQSLIANKTEQYKYIAKRSELIKEEIKAVLNK